MPQLTYFIIRHKPTGNVLPARAGRRGFTHDPPTPALEKDLPRGPRLFKSVDNATYCLRAYCMGPWFPREAADPYQGIDGRPFGPNRKEARNPFDFEIVPLTMNW